MKWEGYAIERVKLLGREMLWAPADLGLRRWEGPLWVGLPPCGPIGLHLLEGACLTLEVVGGWPPMGQ